jgi:hypothetical protein
MSTIPASSNERLSVENLHRTFLGALNSAVVSHSDVAAKPLEVDLKSPLPPKLRVYIYNATYPPGGRTMGEHKIQLIVPGQERGARGNFDSTGGRIPLLMGYRPDLRIFMLWDAELYVNFSYSRNVQVMPETVYEAFARGIGRQKRNLWTEQVELVITTDARHLAEAILERQQETLKRLLGDNE